jgi:hypothetical protein
LALALHANYITVRKSLARTNTLAYFAKPSVTKKRSFTTGVAVAQWLTVSNKSKIQKGLGFAPQPGQIDLKSILTFTPWACTTKHFTVVINALQ